MTFVGRSVGGLWRRKTGVVSASATIDLDSVPFVTFGSIKYIVIFKNASQDVYRSMEISAVRVQGDDLQDSVVARLGDKIDVDAQVLKSGSDVILRLTNNEAYNVDVRVSRLITS